MDTMDTSVMDQQEDMEHSVHTEQAADLVGDSEDHAAEETVPEAAADSVDQAAEDAAGREQPPALDLVVQPDDRPYQQRVRKVPSTCA